MRNVTHPGDNTPHPTLVISTGAMGEPGTTQIRIDAVTGTVSIANTVNPQAALNPNDPPMVWPPHDGQQALQLVRENIARLIPGFRTRQQQYLDWRMNNKPK